MRYVMRQKIFELGDDFTISDEEGKDVFLVDGRAMSMGHKLSFQDMNGRQLAFIKEKLLSLVPTYELYVNDALIAVVKQQMFRLFKHRFHVDVPGPDDLEAEGDFFDHEYTFHRGDDVVGSVSKAYFSWSDTYGIDVRDPKDTVLVLASAIVIDLVCYQEDEEEN
jgi:uncharacterized protein YxjI